jgi:SNF family Na+-dependent transporter
VAIEQIRVTNQPPAIWTLLLLASTLTFENSVLRMLLESASKRFSKKRQPATVSYWYMTTEFGLAPITPLRHGHTVQT